MPMCHEPTHHQSRLLQLQPPRAVHAPGLNEEQLQRIDEVVAVRRKVKARGGTLFRNGESFTSLYAIRTGFFKTCVATEDGRDQVTGFQMAGRSSGWTAS